MSRLLLRLSLLFLLTVLTISSCLSPSDEENRDEEDVGDRQVPGVTPEQMTQMLQTLLAPLTAAASLLPLGRQLPAHEGGDRDAHQAAEGHERNGIGEEAEVTRNEVASRSGDEQEGKSFFSWIVLIM